jgi:hypothetical protein
MGYGTSPEWIRLALEIVGANQPYSANRLRSALIKRGASTSTANVTVLTVIRDGYVRRTWNGKLKLP